MHWVADLHLEMFPDPRSVLGARYGLALNSLSHPCEAAPVEEPPGQIGDKAFVVGQDSAPSFFRLYDMVNCMHADPKLDRVQHPEDFVYTVTQVLGLRFQQVAFKDMPTMIARHLNVLGPWGPRAAFCLKFKPEVIENPSDPCVHPESELMKRDEQWLTRDDLEEMMPGVVVGLPALALLQIVQESLEYGCTEGFRLSEGVAVTELNRPAVRGAAEAYRWALEAKKALAELRPEMAENLFIEARALWEDTEAPACSSFKEGIKVAARKDLRRRSSRLIGLLGLGRTLPAGQTGHVLRIISANVVEVQWDGSDAVCGRHSIRVARPFQGVSVLETGSAGHGGLLAETVEGSVFVGEVNPTFEISIGAKEQRRQLAVPRSCTVLASG
ncbi:unnamed protein product [Symbiodinium natans]|uniref:Uncharacterized protein n=1 Tax=Symbiodinium natans TaxID=878477 RepID=A0A812H8L4_9DINO|nr:unnamed protein product [Symbiodinium natans]